MGKIILSINAGSSSVKISVYSADPGQPPKQLAETQVDGLTAPPLKLKYTRAGKTVAKGEKVEKQIKNQDDAFKFLLDKLIADEELTQISAKEDVGSFFALYRGSVTNSFLQIAYVCHRIVHGGNYAKSKLIEPETYHHIEALTDLAPLHNSSALEIVKSCLDTLPKTKNIACFDSQFHHSLPEHIRTYPIDQEIAKSKGLRKYGFHGISYGESFFQTYLRRTGHG